MSKDRFDKAVDYLTKHPELIHTAWNCAEGPFDGGHFLGDVTLTQKQHKAAHENGACLFQKCGDCLTGCLTQVHSHTCYAAGTPALTKAIRADERIPRNGSVIKVADLPLFADWQRRIEKELAEVAK